MAEKVKFIDIRQKHVEAFSSDLPEYAATKPAIYTGAVVRAAAKAGWFDPPIEESAVGDMEPSEVNCIYMAVMAEYARVETVPPE